MRDSERQQILTTHQGKEEGKEGGDMQEGSLRGAGGTCGSGDTKEEGGHVGREGTCEG